TAPPASRNRSRRSAVERFLEAGGAVIAVEPVPTLLEAEPSDRPARLLSHPRVTVVPDLAAVQGAIEARLARRVSLRNRQGQEAPSLFYMQRRLDRGFAYFIINNDRHNTCEASLALEGRGRLEEWDPLTGEMKGLPAVEKDGRLLFQASFGPAGSRLFVVDPDGQPVRQEARKAAAARIPYLRGGLASFIGPVCPFTRTDPNVLTLDMCQYRLREGEWSDTMEVWHAQREVRERLGMRQVYYNGLPQRYKWVFQPHPQDGAPLALRFRFSVRDVPARPVYLLVEGASHFAIRLNGEAVPNQPVGWYLDRSFHKVALPQLRAGENELVLACAYTNAMELEDCFLLGDFGVSIDRQIIAEPSALHFGDWTTQGYPHYAGSMIYHGRLEHEPGERVRLFLGEYKAVHVAVFVNGQLAGHIPWASANGLDITPYLGPGTNNVDIEVVSSPRNMLGPLHLAAGREPWTDWRSFRRTDDTFTPEYVLQPWGLIGQVRLAREG
ncbi:MAG: hypothetical protein QME94_12200, partial [Anaerolineae bacterium]|nr:hypothetical protein [Anaerolineae bacterium]